MSMTATPTDMPARDISEEDVIAYLKAKKDFFKDHPELLEHLAGPAPSRGRGVVDFQQALDRLMQGVAA